MKHEEIQEAVLASLKKLGPSSPRVIADDAGIEPKRLAIAGGVMLKAKLIQVAGATSNRLWALPTQKLELADLLPAPRKARKGKKAKAAAKPARKAGKKKAGAKRKKRAYTRRRPLGRLATDASIAAAADKLEAQLAARLSTAASPLEKLRIALEEYLAVLTDMRQKLLGAEVPRVATAS